MEAKMPFFQEYRHLNRKVDDISIKVWYYLSISFSAQVLPI